MPKAHQFLAIAVDVEDREIRHLSGPHHTRDAAVQCLVDRFGHFEEARERLAFGLIPVELEHITLPTPKAAEEEQPDPGAGGGEKTDPADTGGGGKTDDDDPASSEKGSGSASNTGEG